MDSSKKDMFHALRDKIKNHAARTGAEAEGGAFDAENEASNLESGRAFSGAGGETAAESGGRTSGAKPVAAGESRRRRH